MVDRLYLTNLLTLINRQDIRTARKWCKRNRVNIYKDMTGEFVYKVEFDLAYDLPLIQDLQLKHGTQWKEVYSLYKSGNIVDKIVFTSEALQIKSYNPKGKVAKSISDGLSTL